MNVTVQGAGVVGSVTAEILRSAGHEVSVHDPEQNFCACGHADVTVVCTPCLDGILPWTVPADVTVVRSTVLPDAFDVLPVGRRHHWPEFLTERTARYDALHPDKLIWGSDLDETAAEQFARLLLGAHYDVAPQVHMSVRASCVVKIGINSLYTSRVMLFNALYDAVGADMDDYESVCEGIGLDQRVHLSHHHIWQDGYRGAGGKCLPKDSRFLAEMTYGCSTGDFVESMCEANDRLRRGGM